MRDRVKKILTWSICIFLLAFSCLLPQAIVRAAGSVSPYDQLIASATSQCIDYLYYFVGEGNPINQWNPFMGADVMDVTIGYDLHNKLYGNADIGSMACRDFNQNTWRSYLLEAFATSINGSYNTNNIICNGEKPGLLKLEWMNSEGEWKASDKCASYIDSSEVDGFKYRFVLNNRTAADSYLNSIYAGDWGSVNNFSDEAKYALYLDEYVAACTTGNSVTSTSYDKATAESESQRNLSGYSDYILKINANGAATYAYYELGNKATKWVFTGIGDSFSGASDCGDLRNKINELGGILHEEYENALVAKIEADKQMCQTRLNAALNAARYLAKEGYEGYDKTVEELEAMNGVYWEMEGDVVHCKTYSTPDKLVKVETETEKDDPNSNNQDITSGAEDSTSNLATAIDEDISECKKATSLGWVLCPTMSLLGKATMGLYNQLSGTWLTINADEVSTGSTLYESWKDFRDYANIGFAILFAIVVFSQVSGIGLSNYNIKKMLPSLIMVAVMVNISFFICQVAVDITNIVGEGIGGVLEHIGDVSMSSAEGRTPFETAGYITAGLFSAAGIALAGYVAAPIVVTSIGTILIAVLLAGISALIGFFFLLILMALRKAILYVVILVAPLAFICYAFPNTKSLFDKWKKLFISLLFVFPICQILVYGGQAMSKLMMSSDENSFFFQFTAMMLQIVPIFFIPMVLRSSMSMLGNIGTKVSAMGARMGHGLSSLAGRSQLANRATVGLNKWGANAFNNSRRMARTPKTALGKWAQANSQARIAGALSKAEELRQADNRSRNITSEGYMANVAASADLQAKEEAANNYISGLKTGAITDEDGNAYDMNDLRRSIEGDPNSTDGALVKLYDQALRDKDDVRIMGLSKYLMDIKGGKGLAVIAAAMRKRGGAAFHSDGSLRAHDRDGRDGFNTAAKYLTSNEKWNMMTKRWDPNMTNLLNDGAMDSDDKIKNRGTEAWAYYNAGAAGKSTPAQMINHDDSYFEGLKNVYGSEAGDAAMKATGAYGDELRTSLASYAAHAQEVFDNPRVYSQAGGVLRDLQGVNESRQAYERTLAELDAEAERGNEKRRFDEMLAKVKRQYDDKDNASYQYEQLAPAKMNIKHGKDKRKRRR